MKKFILLLLSLSSMFSFSQGVYEPFIQENKVWHYVFVTERGGQELKYTYKMYFQGDTIIGDKNCKFLLEERPDEPLLVAGACYEEEGKVWMLSASKGQDGQKPLLLYDFSCIEGDTVMDLYCWRDDKLKVTKTQVVSSFEKERKMTSLCSVNHPHKGNGYWLEGIGSRYDMYDIWPSFAANVQFLYCELNGEMIADQSSFGEAALPPLGIHHVETGKPAAGPYITYDLQGRLINDTSGNQLPGIYIRNRQKFVVK